MTATWTADPFVPESAELSDLAEAVQECRGCPLFAHATQAVFGAGMRTARLVLVGEQPGDREDLEGRPFVGPAGRVLDEALAEAQIDRAAVYVTNAVKHFKWVPQGGRRLHAKPTRREVVACFPWLESELSAIRPEVVVCLGATAAQALLGAAFRLTKHRGELIQHASASVGVLATLHPSAVLRMRSAGERQAAQASLVEDLRQAASLLE